MKEGFVMMNPAGVIVMKEQCFVAEIKKGSIVKRQISYKIYLYSSPQSPITSNRSLDF